MLLNSAFISLFLSTPSARRATHQPVATGVSGAISIHALREEGDYNPFVHTCFFGYFYPRPPRGGRLVEFCQLHQPVVFLSTPSARRATRNSYMFTRFLRDFYPRPPRGGRPEGVTREYFVHIISIHALREEGDMRTVYRVQTAQTFLSTPSARRATCGQCTGCRLRKHFYPRPPRGGRPDIYFRPYTAPGDFYPRPPRGGRPE